MSDEETPEFGYSHVDGTPVTDPHWDAEVIDFSILTGTTVSLKFADGFEGSLDLRPIMRGPVFDEIFERGEFESAQLMYGTIVWPSGADIAPETLRYEAGR